MNVAGKKVELLGNHLCVNIAQKENTTGLTVLSADPRKWRTKPDAYVGVVEAVGPRCGLVKPGDTVVIERWEYKQTDVDDERLIGSEHQVLILGSGKPAPGVVVMKLFPTLPKTTLTLPDQAVRKERKKTQVYCGRVVSSASRTVQVGDIAWVERRERHQYQMPDGRFVFINCQDSWGHFPIWMIGKKEQVEATSERIG